MVALLALAPHDRSTPRRTDVSINPCVRHQLADDDFLFA
jgi:hypothetical protein